MVRFTSGLKEEKGGKTLLLAAAKSLLILELQNGRVGKELLEVIWSKPWLEARPLKSDRSGSCPVKF